MTDHAWVADSGSQPLYQPEPTAKARSQAADRTPRWQWWLWPHLLSLDAPLVAITWQMWWAGSAHVRLSWACPFILGFAVWMIYLADRLADVERAVPGELLTDRHAYYARHKTGLRCLFALVCLTLVISTPILLPTPQFIGGLAMLGATAIYYWMIHHARRPTALRMPKEAIVGTFFSIGSVFFVTSSNPLTSKNLWSNAVLFGALCFLNCGLISAWEQSPQDRLDPSSMLNAFPRLTNALSTGTLLLAVFSFVLAAFAHSSGPLPVVLSAIALWMLNRYRQHLSAGALRLLADVALLTPLPFLAWHLGCR